MLIQPYKLEELTFAWCFRVYYRWRTYRAQAQSALAKLNDQTLDALLQPYNIHVLEASASETDVKVLASLLPTETVTAAAGKLKGRVSKWLREHLQLVQPQKLVSRGYFACTTGQSHAEAVRQYLDKQGEHHGYVDRERPPVFITTYPLTPADQQRLQPCHAVTILRFHLVMATWHRNGVFGQQTAEAVAKAWQCLAADHPMAIEKVSFVPDHVHLAVQAHPGLAPATIVVLLMNAAQELMWREFEDSVVHARVGRLWQPSAYLGGFGDLESAKIAAYVRNWEQTADEAP